MPNSINYYSLKSWYYLPFDEINYKEVDQEKSVFYFHFFEINTCTFPRNVFSRPSHLNIRYQGYIRFLSFFLPKKDRKKQRKTEKRSFRIPGIQRVFYSIFIFFLYTSIPGIPGILPGCKNTASSRYVIFPAVLQTLKITNSCIITVL